MRNRLIFTALLCVGLCVSPASLMAAPVKLLGPDDISCQAWKKQKDPDLREINVQWVRGFLSGHNYAQPSRQVAEVSRATVAMFVDRFCAEHGLATIAEAAMRMSDQYSGRNAPITR